MKHGFSKNLSPGIVPCYFKAQMDNQTATNPASNSRVRLWTWLIVLAVLLFVGFIRFRLLDMPLERDEGEYAYAGQLILQGFPPYELAYNMKLPGTYYAYALGMVVFGQTAVGVHLTLLAVNALTIVFVFLLARKLFGTTAGLVACASYGVMAVSPTILGMSAHATHFVVLFAVPATLLLLHESEDRNGGILFVSGLLYGLAFLMKQQGICFCLFAFFFLVLRTASNKTIYSADFIKRALVLGLGMILPLALFCVCCLIAGDFARFWLWTFIYAHKYASMMPWSEGGQHLVSHLDQSRAVSQWFWLLAAVGLVLAWLNKASRKEAAFAVAFWLFSFLGTAAGLYFRGHYFVLVLPAFAILIGMSVASLQRILSFGRMQNVLRTLPLTLFALILSWVIFYFSQLFFQLSPARVSWNLYQHNPFEESIVVADHIRENSAPDARIAVIGSEPEIYFLARRHSATGYIYTYALMEPQPAATMMEREMMQEIEAGKPEYLVYVSHEFSWLFQPGSNREIFDWFGQYSRSGYDLTGFVHRNSKGEVESFWGDAAKVHANDGGEYVAVFKRKS